VLEALVLALEAQEAAEARAGEVGAGVRHATVLGEGDAALPGAVLVVLPCPTAVNLLQRLERERVPWRHVDAHVDREVLVVEVDDGLNAEAIGVLDLHEARALAAGGRDSSQPERQSVGVAGNGAGALGGLVR